MRKRLLTVFCAMLLLSGCTSYEPAAAVPSLTPAAPTIPSVKGPDSLPSVPSAASSNLPVTANIPPNIPPHIQHILETMSLEDRVAQMFLVRCEQDVVLDQIRTYHPGGLLLFSNDFEGYTKDRLIKKLSSYQDASRIPLLLAVDEEGGDVTRISRYKAFRSARFLSPRTAFLNGGMEGALENEEEKCMLLQELGVNVNLGPVCDLSNDPSAFMYNRSFGQGPFETGEFITLTVRLMSAYRIGSVLKHFPGYGNCDDTHINVVTDNRTVAELWEADFIPFSAGISAGCDGVLVSHNILSNIDSDLPSSLSPAVHKLLREDLGFTGVIMTDDLIMDAIASRYSSGQAAVMAVTAGNDLICSSDFENEYQAVLSAVLSGQIDFDRINESVIRILLWKQKLGLI